MPERIEVQQGQTSQKQYRSYLQSSKDPSGAAVVSGGWIEHRCLPARRVWTLRGEKQEGNQSSVKGTSTIALRQLSRGRLQPAGAGAAPQPSPPRAGRKRILAPVRSPVAGVDRVASGIQCLPQSLSVSICSPTGESDPPCRKRRGRAAFRQSASRRSLMRRVA